MPIPQILYSPEQKEKAFAMYCERIETGNIALALNVPAQTIYKWSCNGKWRTRYFALMKKRGKKPVLTTSPAEQAPDAEKEEKKQPSEWETMSLEERQAFFSQGLQIQALRLPGIIAEMPDSVLVASADKVAKLADQARKALHLEDAPGAILIPIGLLAHIRPKRAQVISCETASELPTIQDTTEEKHTGIMPAATDLGNAGASEPSE